jgi:phenylalanyl-tRNA synthetase beta chain
MNFSYNWLQSFFKGQLPKPEKLAEILTMSSFEVIKVYPVKSAEGGAKQFNRVKKSGKDFILDIDVLPNRAPDCFSHLGIARECAALLGYKLQFTGYRLQEDKKLKANDFIKIEVKNKKACPRYTARIIADVKVGVSPKWLKERLKVCGLQSINNIVDAANYMMLETGQPLHAFDAEKILGRKIIIRKAKEGEKISALDGKKYELGDDMLVIADSKNALAIAGIKGGKKAEIDRNTKTIVLESANFDSITIAKTSKKLNLMTDASLRFEHGIDLNLTEIAVNKVANLISKIAKGKIAKGLIDFYPKRTLSKKINLDLSYVERLIGTKIPEKEIISIFKKLGFKIRKIKSQLIEVNIPTFRLDIVLPEDLIEEIARIYGYQKVPSISPMVALIPPKRNLDIFWEDMVKNILKDMGFSEVYNYSFISKKEVEIFNFKNLIEIDNPLSSDYQYLRPSLIPNLFKNVGDNFRYFNDIRIFELGKIFKKEKNKEKRMLTGLMTGDKFFEVKGVVDLLFNKLGIAKVWYDEFKPTPEESKISCWVQKKCAEIKVNQEEIGFLGEISPKIMGKLKITNKVVAFDLDFEKLSQLASEEHEFRPISAYPAAIQDIAVLVPRDVSVEDVLNKIEITGGKLVRDVDLFDIYEGEELPEGKKNLAFHIIYQAEDRTLSSKEIDKIHKKIISALEENSEWQVRK